MTYFIEDWGAITDGVAIGEDPTGNVSIEERVLLFDHLSFEKETDNFCIC